MIVCRRQAKKKYKYKYMYPYYTALPSFYLLLFKIIHTPKQKWMDIFLHWNKKYISLKAINLHSSAFCSIARYSTMISSPLYHETWNHNFFFQNHLSNQTIKKEHTHTKRSSNRINISPYFNIALHGHIYFFFCNDAHTRFIYTYIFTQCQPTNLTCVNGALTEEKNPHNYK